MAKALKIHKIGIIIESFILDLSCPHLEQILHFDADSSFRSTYIPIPVFVQTCNQTDASIIPHYYSNEKNKFFPSLDLEDR